MTANKTTTENGFFNLFSGLNRMLPEKIKAMDLYSDFYTRIYDLLT
ncbi:MAG: hypothetical protein GY765_38345, partial [bacterium]|nr:hypothetical protein [bacterium]